MRNVGWNLDVWQNYQIGVAYKCRRGTNWFGFSDGTEVGTVSTTLQGNGVATLDFGNCWDLSLIHI